MTKCKRTASSIVLTREGKHWLAKDTLSGVSSFGDSEMEAYRMLAEALSVYLEARQGEAWKLPDGWICPPCIAAPCDEDAVVTVSGTGREWTYLDALEPPALGTDSEATACG